MNQYKKFFQEIAKREGVTVKEVYQKIQEAINAGYDSPDPNIHGEWKKIPTKNGRPTPEDVIAYCVKEMASHSTLL